MPLIPQGNEWFIDSRLHDLYRELDRLDGWHRHGRIDAREHAHRSAVVRSRIRAITRPQSSEQHHSERLRTAAMGTR